MDERRDGKAVALDLRLPAWALAAERAAPAGDRDARMRLVLDLARENVRSGAGGPFAAAIFERAGGMIVAAGVNSVVRLGSSLLHAEIVAIARAQARLGSWSLRGAGLPEHEVVASSEPCAMCLGAILWSGASSLVCGASREDAERIGFDEGPVTPGSYRHLESRGIAVARGVHAEEARQVLEEYRRLGGAIYNP